jgi:hypothetical protein
VPKRRTAHRPLQLRFADAGMALVWRGYAKATRRPVDTAAVLAAVAASLIIIANAAFLQSASRPSPYFANPKPRATIVPVRQIVAPGISSAPATSSVQASQPAPQPVAMRRNDPIADLIGPSPRIAAAQKVLSDYGYGQMKPTGTLDSATSGAIEKFERERKMPITGRVSDRLMSELANLAGHPIE